MFASFFGVKKSGFISHCNSPFLPAQHEDEISYTLFNIDEYPQECPNTGDMVFSTGYGLQLRRGEIALAMPNTRVTNSFLQTPPPVLIRAGEYKRMELITRSLLPNSDHDIPRFGDPIIDVIIYKNGEYAKVYKALNDWAKYWDACRQLFYER